MWRSPESFSLSDIEKKWLTYDLSLSKKLTEFFKGNFHITVHKEFFSNEIDESFSHLQIHNDKSFFIREVFLNGNGIPLIFARTVIPQSTLNTNKIPFLQLENTPLGNYLFDNNLAKRQELQIDLIDSRNILHQLASQALGENLSELWCRGSIYTLDEKPFLVTETFLDEFWGAIREY